MIENKLSSHRHTNKWKSASTPKLDQFRKSHKEKRDDNRELCEKAFNEFCHVIGCEPIELTKKVAKGGGFYIALKYVCAYFIHVRGGNDANIGRLLKKERTTILHGRNEVKSVLFSQNFIGRFWYKLLLEKITPYITKDVNTHHNLV